MTLEVYIEALLNFAASTEDNESGSSLMSIDSGMPSHVARSNRMTHSETKRTPMPALSRQ